MTILSARLAKLEDKLGANHARLIVVRSSGPAPSEEIERFLAEHVPGFDAGKKNLIVSIRRFAPAPPGIELISVTNLTR